jgi:hypothetical protein
MQIHDLLHEALANVEMPIGEGRELIDRVVQAENDYQSGSLSQSDMEELIEEIGEGIEEAIAKEEANNNPHAAVMQVRELLNQLSEMAESD